MEDQIMHNTSHFNVIETAAKRQNNDIGFADHFDRVKRYIKPYAKSCDILSKFAVKLFSNLSVSQLWIYHLAIKVINKTG